MFQNKTRLDNNFHFKDRTPKDLTFGVVYKFILGSAMSHSISELVWWISFIISFGISPLANKQVKSKSSSVTNNLQSCNTSASYGGFSILTREDQKCLLELKESLLLIWVKPWNRTTLGFEFTFFLVIRLNLEPLLRIVICFL